MACCDDSFCSAATRIPTGLRWRRALWVALGVNAGFFLAEIVAGAVAGSASLQADALDFLGDALNYGISLGVVGLALVWRSRAALVKGGTMLVFALWVLGLTAWRSWTGTLPAAVTMGTVGALALLANGAVACMLFRYRNGDANGRSAWLCARNDAFGNVAVLLAAAGVFGTGNGWPDVAVAAIMGGLALRSGRQVMRQARRELASGRILAAAE